MPTLVTANAMISPLIFCALVGVVSAGNALNNPCLSDPYKSQTWCDATKTIDERVADMISRMDLKTEKIPNLNTGGSAIKSLGLNGYNWWEEVETELERRGHLNLTFVPFAGLLRRLE